MSKSKKKPTTTKKKPGNKNTKKVTAKPDIKQQKDQFYETPIQGRRNRVKIYRFVQFMEAKEIAKLEGGISVRTIERDIEYLKSQLRGEDEFSRVTLIDLFDKITLSFEKRMSELWQMYYSFVHNNYGERKKRIKVNDRMHALKVIKEIRRNESSIVTEYKRLGFEVDPELLDKLSRIREDEAIPKEEKPKELIKLLAMIDKMPEDALRNIGDALVDKVKK